MAHVLRYNRIKFPKDFFSIVLYSNMAAVTSGENHLYNACGFPWEIQNAKNQNAIKTELSQRQGKVATFGSKKTCS